MEVVSWWPTLVGCTLSFLMGLWTMWAMKRQEIDVEQERADRWQRHALEADKQVDELLSVLADEPGARPVGEERETYLVVIDEDGGKWVAHGPELDDDDTATLEKSLVAFQSNTELVLPYGWNLEDGGFIPMPQAQRPVPWSGAAGDRVIADLVEERDLPMFPTRPGAEKYPFSAAAGPAPQEGPEISDVWPGYAETVAADEKDAP
jgi:hypothetical protein